MVRTSSLTQQPAVYSPKMESTSEKIQHKLEKIDKEKLKQRFDLSHFGIDAIIRGMQLTLVGGQSTKLIQG